ncbi:MAG: OmpH family outer membrane protein [candidate division WOR-3 bacterium]
MKKVTLATLFLLLFLSFLNAKEIKIAIVDLQRVFDEYIEFQSAKRELDRYVLEWERQRDSLKRYIDSLKQNLEIERPGLTDKGIQKKEIEINKAQERYSNFIRNVWGQDGLFYKKSQELLNPYYQKIQETIKKIAKANDVDLVLNNDTKFVLYISNAIDLTSDVLQELNRNYVMQGEQKMAKVRIATFPLVENDPDAQKLQLGTRIQKSIYQALTGLSNIELLSTSEVNKEISRRNLTNNQLLPETCQQLALSLNSDYFIRGTVGVSGEQVNFTYELYKTATMEKVSEITGSAPNQREGLDIEAIQKAKLLIQQFKF